MAVQPVPAEQEIPLQQWMAPPFWKPDAPASHTDRRGGGRETNSPSSLPTDPMPYVAMTPCRLVDTRATSGFAASWGAPSLPAGVDPDPSSLTNDRLFPATSATPGNPCPIPAGARAIAANVTAWQFAANGKILLYPGDESTRPTTATVNYRLFTTPSPAATLAQVYAIIPLDATGKFLAFSNRLVDLIVDVNGYYAPVATFSPVSAVVSTPSPEATFNAPWGDLATVGPAVAVTVPASGKVLLTLSALVYNSGQATGEMSFEAVGPTPLSPSFDQSLTMPAVGYTQGSWTRLLNGLSPGSYTFTAKYRSFSVSSGGSSYNDRQIIVIPVP
jgi:hypothetical protein